MNNPLKNLPYTLRICLLAFQVLFAAGVIAYFIFGVVFIIIDRNVCPASPLWVFAVIYFMIMIINLLIFFCTSMKSRATSAMKFKDDPNDILSENFSFILYHSVMNTSLFIYNTIVLYTPGYVCSRLLHSGLYIWSFFYWALLLFTSIVFDYTVIQVYRDKLRLPPVLKNMVRDGEIGLQAEGEKLM